MNRQKNDEITLEKKKILVQYIFVLTVSLLLGISFALLMEDGLLLSMGERIHDI